MKATELRIGNYFFDKTNNQKFQVGFFMGMNYLETACEYEPLTIPINEIEPIPLTPDELEKFGFEKAGNEYYKKSIGEYLELSWHFLIDNSLCVQTKKSGFKEPTHITKAHQLQNLYFALAGEELTYTT